MTTWGSYEAVKELAQSGLGFLWTARRSTAVVEGETYVIKTTEGLALLGDAERLERESALFLEAARAQVKLTEQGAKHWSKLHEVGRTDVGAYYVTDMYARSVQSLVARGIRLDARSLSVLVHAVVDGLQEIGTLLGRPHGNLKRSNVLIGGPDGPTIYDDPVVLTDPKPGSAVTAQDGAEDLRAVGRLIYELVMLRPARDQFGLSVSLSEEWSRLGGAAAAWVDLCNQLMGAGTGRPAPDLEEVRGMIPSARAAAARRRWPMVAAAAGLVLVGGAAATYVILKKPAEPPPIAAPKVSLDELGRGWVALVYDWRNWYQPNAREALRGELEKLGRAGGVGEGDERLKKLVEVLREAKPVKSPAEAIGEEGADLEELRKLRPSERTGKNGGSGAERMQADLSATMGAVRAARRAVLDILEAPAGATAAAWGERGWDKASGALAAVTRVRGLLEDAPERPDPTAALERPETGDVVEAVRSALAAVRAEGALARVEALGKTAGERDPALQKLGEAAKAAGAKALGAGGAGKPAEVLAAAVEGVEAAGKRYAEAIGEGKLDLAAFLASEEHGAVVKAGALDAGGLEKLAAAAAAPAFKPYADRAAAEELAKTRQALLELVAKGEKRLKQAERKGQMGAEDVRRVGEDLKGIGEAAGKVGVDVAGNARVLSPASAGVFRGEYAGLKQRVTVYLEGPGAIKGCDLETEGALREELAKVKLDGAPRLKPLWDRLVTAMIAAKLERQSLELDLCDKRDELVDKWKPVLERLSGADYLTAVSAAGYPAEALAGVRRRQQEALLDAAAKQTPKDLLDAEQFAKAVESGPKAEYERWRAGAEKALADASRAAGMLKEGRGTAAELAALVAPAKADEALSGLVTETAAEAATLEAIAKEEGIGALLDRLEAAKASEVAVKLAAWGRLASAAWGGAEAGLVERAARAAAGISAGGAGLTPEREKEVAGAMRASAAGVWVKLAGAAMATGEDGARTAAFERVRELAGRFGAGLAEAKKAGARAGYAWVVLEARAAVRALEGLTPEEESAQVERQCAAIEGYAKEAGLGGEKDVVELLGALRKAGRVDGKTFDAGLAGPMTPGLAIAGLMGWKVGRVDEAAGEVEYTAGTHRLAFVTVKLGGEDGPEVLISTREVTAGLFAEVLKRSGIAADAAWGQDTEGTTTLLPMPTSRADPRSGPRVWTSDNGRDIIGVMTPADRDRQTWSGWFPWTESLRTPTASFAWLPQGVKLAPPTLDHPMQQVTPEGAVLAARLLGCRLPTGAEWRAAGASAASEAPNLRDADWKAPRDVYVQSIIAWDRSHSVGQLDSAQMPSGGIFLPADRRSGFDPRKDDAALEGSDGSALFRPARAAAGENKVHDLVGNVAEYVLSGPEAVKRFEALPAKCTPDEAFGYFATGKQLSYGAVRVVGGSAISPPAPAGWDPSAELEVQETSPKAYSDVGFRLAISKGEGASGKTPRARAETVLRTRFKVLGK